MMRSRNTATFLAVGLIGALLAVPAVSAFALQPYVAGYSVQSPIKNALAVATDTKYTGTTLSGLSTSLFGIVSVAGISSTTATDPSTYLYQSFPHLTSTGAVRGNAEVWKATLTTSCSNTQKADPASISLVAAADYSTLDRIAHSIGFLDTAKTTFRFNFHVYKTSGSSQSFDMYIAKSSYDSGGDPTKFFMVGDQTIAASTKVKFLQIGVEHGNTGNTGWKVTQKNMVYSTSPTNTVNLSTKPAKSLGHGPITGDQYNSFATYHKVGTSYCFSLIGTTAYVNTGADYNLKSSTVPKGEIRWFNTTVASQKIAKGTSLWN